MNLIKGLFISTLISLSVSAAILYFAPKLFKVKIENYLSAKMQGKIRFTALKWQFGEAQELGIYGVLIELPKQGLSGTIQKLSLGLPLIKALTHRQIDLIAEVIGAQLQMTAIPSPEVSPPPVPQKIDIVPQLPGIQLVFPYRVSLRLKLQQGEILYRTPEAVSTITLDHLDLDSAEVFSSLKLNVEGQFLSGNAEWLGKIPFSMQTQVAYEIATPILTNLNCEMKIWGIPLSLNGKADFSKADYHFLMKTEVPQLNKLPIPPQLKMIESWQGKISAQTQFAQTGLTPWKSQTSVQLDAFAIFLNHKMPPAMSLHGWLVSSGSLSGKYSPNSEPQLSAQLSINGDQSEILYRPYLAKPKGITLKFQFSGAFENSFAKLQNSLLRIGQIELLSRGEFNLKSSDFNAGVEIKPTQLAGLEKLLPVLAQSQPTQLPSIQGEISLNASAQGNTQKLSELRLQISPLTLKGGSAFLNFQLQDLLVQGPVQAQAHVDVNLLGTKIGKAQVTGFANGTQLTIRKIGNFVFNKKPGQNLNLNLVASQFKDSIRINQARLFVPSGSVSIEGVIENPLEPNFNLKIESTQLDLATLLDWFPDYKQKVPAGKLSFKTSFAGQWNKTLGIEGSHLKLDGDVNAQLQTVQLQGPPPNSTTPDKNEVDSSPVGPLLPQWPIIKTSSLRWTLNLQKFSYGQMLFEQLSANGVYAQGNVKTNLLIQSAFGGKVDIKSAEGNLNLSPTLFKISSEVSNLQMKTLLSQFLPEYRDFADGLLSLTATTQLKFPWGKSLIESLQMDATQRLSNSSLKGAPIFAIIKEKLSKIPGVGDKLQQTPQDVLIQQSGNFSLKNGELRIAQMNMSDQQKNEFSASGQFSIPTKSLAMEGQVYLAQAPVSGSFKEANQDASGRLIVPLKITGSLKNLDYHLYEETIKKMVEKALALELNRQKAQVQVAAQARLQEEKKKLEAQAQTEAQRLKEEAEKKVKDLLRR